MAGGEGESVWVLKPSSLGDIVHTLPAVARMKAARPEWRISWLVNTEWAPLLEGNPDVAEVIAFPRREFRGPGSWPKLARWVGRNVFGKRPAAAIDFQGLLRTAMLARLSGARSSVGPSDAREGAAWLYHATVPMPGGTPHAVERYLALADGIVGSAASDAPLRYPLPGGTMPARAERLGPFVLLHPFSRGEGKSLTPEQVRELSHMLAPHRVVVVGQGGPVALPENGLDLLNATSLSELLWLIRHASFVISVDSGPMHLAAALDRPLVGIHRWTDPRKVGPYRPDAWVWKGGRLFQMRDRGGVPSEILAAPSRGIQRADLEEISRIALHFD